MGIRVFCIYEVIDLFEFPEGACNTNINIGDIICLPCEDPCSELVGSFRIRTDSFCGLLLSRTSEICQSCPLGAKKIPTGFETGPLIPPDAAVPEE